MDEQAHRARLKLHAVSEEAADNLIAIMRGYTKDKLPATESVLNRTIGKATDSLDVNLQGGFTVNVSVKLKKPDAAD